MNGPRRFISQPDGSIKASWEYWGWLSAYVTSKANADAARNGGVSPLAVDFVNAAAIAQQLQVTTPAPVPLAEPDTRGTGIIEVSAAEAANMRGCSPEMIRRMCRTGQLQARRLGRTWLVDATHLNKTCTGEPQYGNKIRSQR